MKRVEYYRLPNGQAPFNEWISHLDDTSRMRILTYIARVADGGGKNNIKPVGEGVSEIKLNFGPGFRVYFAEKDLSIVLLLLGGDKKTQAWDIQKAKMYWRNYVQKQHIS